MRKNIKIIIILMLVIIELSTMFLMYKSLSNKEIELDNVKINKVDKKTFAVLLEQSDGSYLEVDSWPNEGYVYDSVKSGCMDENGIKIENALLFDTSTNVVSLQTNKTSYCYLYFKQPVCTLAADTTVAAGKAGAKYNCKVDPNKDEYTFYLLDNNEDGTSDLIMNANINASGEAVIPGVTSDDGHVAWAPWDNNGEPGNSDGPFGAIEYLYNATKSWTNVEPVNYTYNDREAQGITSTIVGYQSFSSTNGVGIIIKGYTNGMQVTIGTHTEPLRARMPIYTSDANATEVADKTDVNAYLYDNLDGTSFPNGYWTLSSYAGNSSDAWDVFYDGYIRNGTIYYNFRSGVRPVITIKL